MVMESIRSRFDTDYYSSCYAEVIPPGTDAFAHFMETGWKLGFRPSASFDPIVYALAAALPPGVNALVEAVRRYGTGNIPCPEAGSFMPASLRLPSTKGEMTVADDPAANIEHGKAYAGATDIRFAVDRQTYTLRAPDPAQLLGRIRGNRPFAMARISQGDWDGLWAYESYVARLSALPSLAGFSEMQRCLLALRLCDAWHGELDFYVEHFLIELYKDLRHREPDHDFMICAAFKGYPTADERLFEWSAEPTDEDLQRLRLYASFFSPDETVYEATVWKRWLVSGDLKTLPDLCRRHPVILMGGDVLSDLGERWSLPHFLHVPMPLTRAYALRHRLLEHSRAAVADAKATAARHGLGQPIFLLQGSSLAYWFIERLHRNDPDVFYLDVGQALHAWFYDKLQIPLRNWGRLYGPTIVANNELEPWYAERGVAQPVISSLFKGRITKGFSGN